MMNNKKPLRDSEEIINHLYGGVIGKAQNRLAYWIGKLDAPTEELRAIESLLDQLSAKDAEIESLKAEVMVHAGDSSECSTAYRKLKARNEVLEKVVEAAKPLLDKELGDSMTVKQNYSFYQNHISIYEYALKKYEAIANEQEMNDE